MKNILAIDDNIVCYAKTIDNLFLIDAYTGQSDDEFLEYIPYIVDGLFSGSDIRFEVATIGKISQSIEALREYSKV